MEDDKEVDCVGLKVRPLPNKNTLQYTKLALSIKHQFEYYHHLQTQDSIGLPSTSSRLRVTVGENDSCPPTPNGLSPANSEDSVRVIVRIRPLNDREMNIEHNNIEKQRAVSAKSGNVVVLTDPIRGGENALPYSVAVDHVLDESSTQEDVFLTAGLAMVDHCMAGFNSSIFAYGQTGSGKTYTMLGDIQETKDGILAPQCGLIPRVFDALFESIAKREQARSESNSDGETLQYSVKCSFLEIYNEEITDLLSAQPSASGLLIRDGEAQSKGVFVQGLSERQVLNANDVLTLILQGSERRRQSATAMNERSSRSHSVFTATIEAQERTSSGVLHVRHAKLNLIDLAGSERVGRTGARGDQLTEAKSINRSLAVLGRVISALVERQRRPSVNTHIPYRDSRLTFLLQESIGGNSKTCIIATVTPAQDSASETYSTLAFASRAKKIRCKPVINEDLSVLDVNALSMENKRLLQIIAELQQEKPADNSEVVQLQQQLEQARSLFDQNNDAIQSMRTEQSILRQELNEAKALAARVAEEAAALRTDNAMLSSALEASESQRDRLMDELIREREATSTLHTQELVTLREELNAAKVAATASVEQIAEARASRKAMEALLEEARLEVKQIQKQAWEDGAAAAAREETLRREVDALRESAQITEKEIEKLRLELVGEHKSARKFKHMVGEIGRLIDWAQASGGAGGGAGGGLVTPNQNERSSGENQGAERPSPAALAALRVARMSLAPNLAVTNATSITMHNRQRPVSATSLGEQGNWRSGKQEEKKRLGLGWHKELIAAGRPPSAAW
jgi:hypothetical protein